MGFNVPSSTTPSPPSTAGPYHQPQHSGWRSPVPYLFGGLAAMLGLIAFALLILACSYWKLSGYQEGEGEGNNGGDIESGGDGKPSDSTFKTAPPVFEQKIVVIMAGDEKPTFLATPMSSRASSFADNNKEKKNQTEDEYKAKMEEEEPANGDGSEAELPVDGVQRAHQEHGVQRNQNQEQRLRESN